MGFNSFFINSKGWLTGSIRQQLTPAERSVWADLLAMANESRFRGVVCRAKGIPYPREYLASYLDIPVELLNSTIEKCSRDENAEDLNTRIMFDEVGCIVITNWDKYQISEEVWEEKRNELKNQKAASSARSRENKKTTQIQQEAITRSINALNKKINNVRYTITENGEVLDSISGVILSVEEFMKIHKENINKPQPNDFNDLSGVPNGS
jgi:hypothetical protein